jgi:predicted lipase
MAYEGPTFKSIFYNGHEIALKIRCTKSFQNSIFFDNLQCTYDMEIGRTLTRDEEVYIDKTYSKFSESEQMEIKKKLSEIRVGEIIPYYIQRYGFYEGHTMWRADPLAIAFIFGIKSLKELEMTFPGKLNEILFQHYISEGY